MVGQPHQNFMKMASWSRVSEHLVNLIGMSDQLKWNNQSNELKNFALDIRKAKESVLDITFFSKKQFLKEGNKFWEKAYKSKK